MMLCAVSDWYYFNFVEIVYHGWPIVDKYFNLLKEPLPDCLTDCQISMLGCLASHSNL